MGFINVQEQVTLWNVIEGIAQACTNILNHPSTYKMINNEFTDMQNPCRRVILAKQLKVIQGLDTIWDGSVRAINNGLFRSFYVIYKTDAYGRPEVF